MKISTQKSERFKTTFLVILGIVLLVSFFLATVFWELQGRKMVQYEATWVANQEINKSDIIGPEMFKQILVEKDALIEGRITDPSQVMGLASKQYIPAGNQFHINMFEDAALITTESQYLFKVPKEWIYSVPSTIRRMDNAVFYALDSLGQVKQRDAEEDNPRLNRDKLNNDNAILFTKIAYVRDSQNKEVKTTSKNDRIDASSNVVDIEIVISHEEFKKMEEYIAKGYKFAVMYY